jgi:predicted  nucleic acid-binding Zn-ribbon protein
LYQQADKAQEEYEKLNVEITVLITEKVSIKKENDRVTNERNIISKDLKVQMVKYNLLMDEVA